MRGGAGGGGAGSAAGSLPGRRPPRPPRVPARSPLVAPPPSVAAPRFGVFFCGILPRAASIPGGGGGALAAPTLHVIGRRDPAAPLSRALAAACVDPVVVEHERGHVIPRLAGEGAAAVRAFFDSRAADAVAAARL